MLKIWNDIGVLELSEQNLAGQALAIETNCWLSELEIEKRMRNLNQNIEDSKRSNTEVLEGYTGEVDNHENNDEQIQRVDYETIIETIIENIQ